MSESASYSAFSIRFGLVVHPLLSWGGPPWRRPDSRDGWAISDSVTGYGIAGLKGFETPLAALKALHELLRATRRHTGQAYREIIAASRDTLFWGTEAVTPEVRRSMRPWIRHTG